MDVQNGTILERRRYFLTISTLFKTVLLGTPQRFPYQGLPYKTANC
jgi:hypothetical protein